MGGMASGVVALALVLGGAAAFTPPAASSLHTRRPLPHRPPLPRQAAKQMGLCMSQGAGALDGELILVAGGGGRVGRIVVEELLAKHPGARVRAAVRDLGRGEEALGPAGAKERLELVQCDLAAEGDVRAAMEGVRRVVWCATEYSDRIAPGRRLQWLGSVLPALISPKLCPAADVKGVRLVANALKKNAPPPQGGQPAFVLLSSAAVTRPGWSQEQKEAYPEAAGVPIIKLSPLFFNILGTKLAGEEAARSAGVPLAVVRLCALNDGHGEGRLVLSTGDTATGRISRRDAASLLVSALTEPALEGRAVEAFTIAGQGGVPFGEALAEIDSEERMECMRRYPGSSWLTAWYKGDGMDNSSPEPMMNDPAWRKEEREARE